MPLERGAVHRDNPAVDSLRVRILRQRRQLQGLLHGGFRQPARHRHGLQHQPAMNEAARIDALRRAFRARERRGRGTRGG